jgi:transcriptional regulator with XRE-family HTH domain
MTTHDEYMSKLSPARRAKIAARTSELIAEELTLQELRKAREYSQSTVADLLGMRQGDVSKLEHRADAYLSTIRRYVQALGGNLDLVATFPNRPPVKISYLADLAASDELPGMVQEETSPTYRSNRQSDGASAKSSSTKKKPTSKKPKSRK